MASAQTNAASPALHISGLRHGYRAPEGGVVLALDVPTLDVERGTTVLVQGESGSGKTTLLNVIAGILRVQEGVVEIGGEAMHGRSEVARDRLRARSIGYLFQTFNLLAGLTALENVALGLTFRGGIRGRAARTAAAHSLDRVGLSHRRGHRPSQLSVGQQQRVAIARALVGSPALVLADEPTSNLDRARADEITELLTTFAKESNAGLLVVTHDDTLIARFPNQVALRAPTNAEAAQ